ncbi:MAG: hypothetical protein ACRD1L_11255 [Terriglobales bacterium]
MSEYAGKPVQVLVVWEPVLISDWGPPSTSAMRRLSDARVAQYWDRGRLVSREMGEGAGRGVVWDYVAVYPAGAVWTGRAPPTPLYQGGPVYLAIGAAQRALAQALESGPAAAR